MPVLDGTTQTSVFNEQYRRLAIVPISATIYQVSYMAISNSGINTLGWRLPCCILQRKMYHLHHDNHIEAHVRMDLLGLEMGCE